MAKKCCLLEFLANFDQTPEKNPILSNINNSFFSGVASQAAGSE